MKYKFFNPQLLISVITLSITISLPVNLIFQPKLLAQADDKNITLEQNQQKLENALSRLCLIAYSPTNYDPTSNIFPTVSYL